MLQNTWVAGGTTGRAGLPAGGGAGKPSTVTVQFASGQKVEGTLVRKDDLIVTLLLADGERRSISLEGSSDVPKVDVHDPLDAQQLASKISDKDMHDVTAYLATIK